MITALIFIIVLGVLVLVHELGHFVIAKRAGMKVQEFGFGFPPRLFGFESGGTIYSFNLIPFGGFVRILGEDGGHKDELGSFVSKSILARFKVIVSGVIMNFLLAVVLLMIVNFFGLRIGIADENNIEKASDRKIQIIQISANSPAEKSGLKLLDQIVGFKKGDRVLYMATTKEVQNYVSENAGNRLQVLIKRGSEVLEKEIEARKNPPPGEGATGISLALTGIVSYPWYEAIWRGLYDAVMLLINTIIGYYMLFKGLFTTGKLISDISGPIGIATLTGSAARIGINYLMQFVAMISVNLAVLNFIPFPALDGGRAVMLLVEKIKGRPISKKIEGMINATGFSLLILLMLYVTFRDVLKFF